jgi:hypothetical protein
MAVRPSGERSRDQIEPSVTGHVHVRVALHAPLQSAVGLGAGRLDQPTAQQHPEHHGEQHDHERAAGELGEGELPAQQHCHDHAELDD